VENLERFTEVGGVSLIFVRKEDFCNENNGFIDEKRRKERRKKSIYEEIN